MFRYLLRVCLDLLAAVREVNFLKLLLEGNVLLKKSVVTMLVIQEVAIQTTSRIMKMQWRLLPWR